MVNLVNILKVHFNLLLRYLLILSQTFIVLLHVINWYFNFTSMKIKQILINFCIDFIQYIFFIIIILIVILLIILINFFMKTLLFLQNDRFV